MSEIMVKQEEIFVCTDHIKDCNLKLFINEKGEKRKCCYCQRKKKSVALTALHQHIEECLNLFYKKKDVYNIHSFGSGENVDEINENKKQPKKQSEESEIVVIVDDYEDVTYPKDIVTDITNDKTLQKELINLMGKSKYERIKFEYNGERYHNLWDMFVDYVKQKDNFSVNEIISEAQNF